MRTIVVRRTACRSRALSLAGIALAVIPHLLDGLVRRSGRRRRRDQASRRADRASSRLVHLVELERERLERLPRSTPSTRSRAHSTSSSARSSGVSGGAGWAPAVDGCGAGDEQPAGKTSSAPASSRSSAATSGRQAVADAPGGVEGGTGPGDCWKVTWASVRSRFETRSSVGHHTRARCRGFFVFGSS